MRTIAITGGTGFVGSHLIDLALAEGCEVRALARREQPARAGVTWVRGSLAELGALAQGADAVIHVAGSVNSGSRDEFARANIAGTSATIAATSAAGVQRFVHVSSLSAREPALSNYGWSKAEGERVVEGSGLDWTIVRPPAIFGPRDTEMRELFRFAHRGFLPLPPGGRMSAIYVEDLARLLLTLAAPGVLSGAIVEPDDGTPGGWDHRDFARALAEAVGTRPLILPLPRTLLRAASTIDRAIRGQNAKLTADRVGYLCHPDWVAHRPVPPEVWAAQTDTRSALTATAQWYRANGLL